MREREREKREGGERSSNKLGMQCIICQPECVLLPRAVGSLPTAITTRVLAYPRPQPLSAVCYEIVSPLFATTVLSNLRSSRSLMRPLTIVLLERACACDLNNEIALCRNLPRRSRGVLVLSGKTHTIYFKYMLRKTQSAIIYRKTSWKALKERTLSQSFIYILYYK